jgi:hypothetical protein
VPPKPLLFETLHGGSTIRFLGERLRDCPKHLLPGDMTREAGQGSGSAERVGGYDQFSSLLFYVLQVIYVSYIHLCCFVCSHRIIQTVLLYYIMTCLISVHASDMLYLFVSCCLSCYLFIFNCSVILYAYHIYMIYMIHMLCVLMIHIIMDIIDITIFMDNYLLYVIIIMLIYGIKMIWKMTIILTSSAVTQTPVTVRSAQNPTSDESSRSQSPLRASMSILRTPW